VVVTTEGVIERIGLGDGEARRVGELELPDGAVVSAVHPTLAGQRLVVVAEQFLAVVDLEGNVLYPSDEPADEASEPAALAADPPWGARCIALTPASSDGNAAIVSLTDGVVLAAEPADAVLDVSADGCTVLTRSAGEVAVLADGRLARLGSATSARLAPDGRAAAVWRDVRTLELIVFDDSLEPEPPIDLTSALPATRSDVVFLDR